MILLQYGSKERNTLWKWIFKFKASRFPEPDVTRQLSVSIRIVCLSSLQALFQNKPSISKVIDWQLYGNKNERSCCFYDEPSGFVSFLVLKLISSLSCLFLRHYKRIQKQEMTRHVDLDRSQHQKAFHIWQPDEDVEDETEARVW